MMLMKHRAPNSQGAQQPPRYSTSCPSLTQETRKEGTCCCQAMRARAAGGQTLYMPVGDLCAHGDGASLHAQNANVTQRHPCIVGKPLPVADPELLLLHPIGHEGLQIT